MAKGYQQTIKRILPWILIVGGFLGITASFVLTMDKIRILQDPDYQAACNLNPVLSCGSVITTEQASAFGFPNPFLGLAGFAVVITIGMGILAGARYKRWFWLGLNTGALLGTLFIHWLTYQSLYRIGALCLYCMLVWSVTWPIFWYTTLYNLQEKHLPTPSKLAKLVNFAQRHHLDILISWYVIIIGLIIHNFWYYWSTLL